MLSLGPIGNVVQIGVALGRHPMPLLLASLVGLGNPTVTQEPIVISGTGTLSCERLTGETLHGRGYAQSKLTVATFSWVQGYLSALNVVAIAQAGVFADLRTITEEEQWTDILEFCRRNPDRFVIDAAQEIMKTRLKIEIALPQPK